MNPYALITGSSFGLYAVFLLFRFTEINKKDSYVFFISGLLYSISSYINQLNTEMSVDVEMGALLSELVSLFLISTVVEGSVWRVYGKIMEAGIVRTALFFIVGDGRDGMLHKISVANGNILLHAVIVYGVTILSGLIVEGLLRIKLIGKIPYKIWKWMTTLAFSLMGINIFVQLLSGMTFFTGGLFTFYLGGLLPLIISVVYALILNIQRQREINARLEKLINKKYEYYDDMNRLYGSIRELRHDIANHIQVLESLEGDKKREYLENILL